MHTCALIQNAYPQQSSLSFYKLLVFFRQASAHVCIYSEYLLATTMFVNLKMQDMSRNLAKC